MQLLRPMRSDDINAVVNVIDSHDEDDAAEAREGYESANGIEDQFVMEQDGKIIGVSGYATPPGCENTHWLSWTYVHADHVNKGYGRKIINELTSHLKSQNGRKLFVKISDYAEENDDGENTCIYAAALHLYKDIGFTEEAVLKDYYDNDETMTILGLRLSPKETDAEGYSQETQKIQFNSIFEIAETDGAYSFGWAEKSKTTFNTNDVKLGVDNVREREGRAVFLSFPHTYSGIADTLYSAGFSNAGMLEDYFDDGLHEQHFSYYL